MANEQEISNKDPFIYFNGRWDSSPGTWWAGSGFKLNVQNLSSLELRLGPNTTFPHANIGVSLDYSPYFTIQGSEGRNVVPLNFPRKKGSESNTVVRIVVQGWEKNRIILEGIILNHDAKLLPYNPQKLVFQFIGDSLSAGQYHPQGINQAWPLLVGERFRAETRVNAQPGAALSDIVSYGNQHGLSFQFFQTEDTGYHYTSDHKYTTPWDFSRDVPPPSIIIVHLGANDDGQKVPPEVFTKNGIDFYAHLREIYPTQPIVIFTSMGGPVEGGGWRYRYVKEHTDIYNSRRANGDENIHIIDGTGFLEPNDIDPNNHHPTVAADAKIAFRIADWLEQFGIKPEPEWATSVT